MVRTERQQRVELIILDRPERRNALDHATLLELLEVQARVVAGGLDEGRAVVLTGAAPAFCAGADLAGVEDPTNYKPDAPSVDFLRTNDWHLANA
jgi:enoyl-CoA hydratase